LAGIGIPRNPQESSGILRNPEESGVNTGIPVPLLTASQWAFLKCILGRNKIKDAGLVAGEVAMCSRHT
jgi:hypothetical protein